MSCWMVWYHNRIWCISWVLLVGAITFSTTYFLNVYITLILNSNGPGDISSRPLLLRITTMVILGVFWHYFFRQNFVVGRHTNVAIHSLSLSLPPSLSLRQLPCLKAQTTEQWWSHTQGECIAQIAMYSPTGTKQPHKRTFTACSTSASIFLVTILSYTCMFGFASVECETVLSILCFRLEPVLLMGGHDGADSTYSYSCFGSYNCLSCSWIGHAER
jgi:hypothetical protein